MASCAADTATGCIEPDHHFFLSRSYLLPAAPEHHTPHCQRHTWYTLPLRPPHAPPQLHAIQGRASLGWALQARPSPKMALPLTWYTADRGRSRQTAQHKMPPRRASSLFSLSSRSHVSRRGFLEATSSSFASSGRFSATAGVLEEVATGSVMVSARRLVCFPAISCSHRRVRRTSSLRKTK